MFLHDALDGMVTDAWATEAMWNSIVGELNGMGVNLEDGVVERAFMNFFMAPTYVSTEVLCASLTRVGCDVSADEVAAIGDGNMPSFITRSLAQLRRQQAELSVLASWIRLLTTYISVWKCQHSPIGLASVAWCKSGTNTSLIVRDNGLLTVLEPMEDREQPEQVILIVSSCWCSMMSSGVASLTRNASAFCARLWWHGRSGTGSDATCAFASAARRPRFDARRARSSLAAQQWDTSAQERNWWQCSLLVRHQTACLEAVETEPRLMTLDCIHCYSFAVDALISMPLDLAGSWRRRWRLAWTRCAVSCLRRSMRCRSVGHPPLAVLMEEPTPDSGGNAVEGN